MLLWKQQGFRAKCLHLQVPKTIIKGNQIWLSLFCEKAKVTENIVRGSNTYIILLISKTGDPLTLKDYRPINLRGCMHKVLSMILANRLTKVIKNVIDKE